MSALAINVTTGRRVTKQLIVFDLGGLSYWPDRKAFAIFRKVLAIDEKYYPETLGEHVMINAPWIFKGCWRIIRPWLDPTPVVRGFPRKHFVFCGSSGAAIALECSFLL